MDIYPVQCLTVQATPFCNLNCKYCYLPNRTQKGLFDMDLIPYIFKNMEASGLLGDDLFWDWHAGEPLVAGLDFYEETTRRIKKYKPKQVKLQIGMQTNATLITEEIAAFFKKNKFRIGVSIDGPEHIQNHNRVFRNNKGSFNEVVRGISLLKKHRVPFHTISVLSNYSMDYAKEMYAFFRNMNPLGVAFNIEEVEGIHTQSTISDAATPARFEAFFEEFFGNHLHHQQPFQIREWNKFVLFRNNKTVNGTTVPFAHLTMDMHGNYSTFSPELVTIENNKKYPSFIFGNIKDDLIIDCISRQNFKEIYADIKKGVAKCKRTCSYFGSCGGGMVSNKLFENGSFNSTTTMACTYMEQKLADLAIRISQ